MDRNLFFFRAKEYIKYRLRAKDEHGIHSPFLFELYNELMREEKEHKDFYFAENFREALLDADESIRKNGVKVPLGKEIESSAIPPQQAQFIYKLVSYFKPETLLELGTNAGLSSLYLALATRGQNRADIYTIEGNDDLYDKAVISTAMLRYSFIGLPEVNFIKGQFKDILPGLLTSLDKLDFVLIDGDHRGEALIDYFNQCLTKANDKTIFVLDDIYWSPDMLGAWQKIIQHPKVTMSLDLFHLGVLFLDPAFSREHFTLKWSKQKPTVKTEA